MSKLTETIQFLQNKLSSIEAEYKDFACNETTKLNNSIIGVISQTEMKLLRYDEYY